MGSALPGVAVALQGPRGTWSTASAEDGRFRFLHLQSGSYTLRVAKAGFTTLEREVHVAAGDIVGLAFVLAPTAADETRTLAAQTPLVDIRRRSLITTLTEEELYETPNPRDVWSALDTVAGVLGNRVNVAGISNGQARSFTSKGVTSSEASWSLDGVEIAEMSVAGAQAIDYDFGAPHEISVTSGAHDLSTASGGLAVSLVTRSGTNRLRGGARFLISDEDLSFSNLPDSLARDPRLVDPDGSRRSQADHIQQSTDWGFDLGGPILKDRLWFQAGWGEQDVRMVRLVGTRGRTSLAGWNARLDWRPSRRTMLSLSWFDHARRQAGRTVHGGVEEDDSFLADLEDSAGDEVGDAKRPLGLLKLQLDHTVSPRLFLSAKVASLETGSTQTPRGGTDRSFTIDYDRGQAIGSSPERTLVTSQRQVLLDGSYFFRGLGGGHELKFGFGYRDTESTSLDHYGGNQLVGWIYGPEDADAAVVREGLVSIGGSHWSAYVGDVFTKSRTRLHLGLRWDGQSSGNRASSASANVSFPERLPAVAFDGGGDISWSTVQPRLGVSYALDEERRTVLRASYACYAQRLPLSLVAHENPAKLSFLAYDWHDVNGDRLVQREEVDEDTLRWSSGVDPADPAAATETVDRFDPDFAPMRDHEFVLAVDREIRPGLVAGAAYTWRRTVSFSYSPRMGASCASAVSFSDCSIIEPHEYIAGEPLRANGYTAFAYAPPRTRVVAGRGGRLLTNAPGYDRTYGGLDVTLTKRLSNGWMARLAFTWHDWSENWHGTAYSTAASWDGNPTPSQLDPLVEGGEVTLNAGRVADSNIKWQLRGNALVQLPWDITLSTALLARQGSVYPISLLVPAGEDGPVPALAFHEIDSLRYDTVFTLDLRLAKTVRIAGAAALVLSAEWFNVTNSDLVIGRYLFANSLAFTDVDAGAIEGRGRIDELIGPSTFRFGARLVF